MTQINDMLNESFRGHRDALARAGGLGDDFERGAVKAIRRRRNVRAAGAGAGSVLAIGVVGAAVVLTPGVRGGNLFEPAAAVSTWPCNEQRFLGPNPPALGDAPFAFRAYIEVADGAPSRIAIVRRDGSGGDIWPDAEGNWVYRYGGRDFTLASADQPADIWSAGLVGDYYTDGTGGGVSWDGKSNIDGTFGWTTRVPAVVPTGIDTAALSRTLMTAIGLGGRGLQQTAVPEGAVVHAVIVDADGERITQLFAGDSMPSINGSDDTGQAEVPVDGLESVAIRVTNLPDGQTFSIVSTYDPSVFPVVTCLKPAPGASQMATPSPTPSPWNAPMPGATAAAS